MCPCQGRPGSTWTRGRLLMSTLERGAVSSWTRSKEEGQELGELLLMREVENRHDGSENFAPAHRRTQDLRTSAGRLEGIGWGFPLCAHADKKCIRGKIISEIQKYVRNLLQCHAFKLY